MYKKIKIFIKKFVPSCYWDYKKKRIYQNSLKHWNNYWDKRALLYADISRTREAKEALLLAEGHVLEKGIAMPNRRLGFGYEKVRSLINHCKEWLNEYGEVTDALMYSIDDLVEYYNIHDDNGFDLPDDIVKGIKELQSKKQSRFEPAVYFADKSSLFSEYKNFEQLAHQRHSIRNYSDEPVDVKRVLKAVELAQTAPSACNRQGVRVKIVENKAVLKKVLDIQNGNRGFGHLADKIILLTFEQGAIEYEHRAAGYIDVGIFAMNLLYALHVQGICACTLNAHLSIDQMAELRNCIGFKESEIPVLFILIGNAPNEPICINASKRLSLDYICKVI